MIQFDDNVERRIYSSREFEQLSGYLDEGIAKQSLSRFLYSNLGFTVKLLFGIEIFPYQEIILRGWFDHNFNYFVATRGGAKSFLAALYACLYPIFYPETKIIFTSNSFRATRRLINTAEKLINAKEAVLLKQCYTSRTGKIEFCRRADEMVLEINGGSITALPLNTKIRGFRASVLICDEFGQIPSDIYTNILVPFLLSKDNIQEELKLKEINSELGSMSYELPPILQYNKRIVCLTSATYDFEFAYKVYMEWLDKCKTEKKGTRTYFVARMSYKSLPPELVEKEIVEEAKSGGENTASFQREFMAIFSSSSDGYFNIRKLHEYTVRDGQLPCVQLRGLPGAKYILSIDPSFSDAQSSDLFGMGVYMLSPETRSITQVHTYGVAGGELKDHIRYLHYILSSFNVVMVIGDFGGGNFNFIQACNESNYFAERNLKLDFFDGDFDAEDYLDQLRAARNSYKLHEYKICYTQKFQRTEWIRKANEHLQSQIDYGKVYFASRLTGHEDMFKKAIETELPILFEDRSDFEKNILDFIATQDDLIEQTKRQLALIEVKATAQGTMQFDLPQHLRRSKSASRARKDLYTCLLMGCWASKVYLDMTYLEDEPVSNTFDPILI